MIHGKEGIITPAWLAFLTKLREPEREEEGRGKERVRVKEESQKTERPQCDMVLSSLATNCLSGLSRLPSASLIPSLAFCLSYGRLSPILKDR